ncbi:GGDEF domain-containing protein [Octadecabacter sp. 1_MG-2023]|uniref:GGDEF domain-containing protein n=1 Tax=unclassified Octadecabacter TaxID=196158 RepID=UPI001C089ECA|nr:GGDEF domain-containing protein [Octadecabacter sp. 1_MG-2023]MBU2993398.1 GGDEF domain-containing protein [Octadecabacter sp. B2R22]MDO6733146.1 GGDEF domain-containing protein [Octadecabacter sp. 1_MG-2023]
MEQFVNFVSPRNAVDFIGKALAMLAILGALNLLRDVLSYGDGHDSFANNLYEAAFVGTPFVILSLAALGHMQKLQHKLVMLAATDMLTGLPNRRAFMEVVKHPNQETRSDVLMMVDIDHFKRINDTYGHAVGDRCLQELATRFRTQLREQDVVARMGGEEFAVLLVDATPSQAAPIAEQIAQGGLISLEETPIRITTSVGYALRDGDEPADTVLQRADQALYRAKSEGRACARMALDAA